MATGACGLTGWILGIENLKALFPGGVTIKANAALALLLGGGALLIQSDQDARFKYARVISMLCAGVVCTLGGLTLVQHLTGLDLGIDQWLVTEPPGARATSSPGRMGPPACLGLTLTGIGLLLLNSRRASRWKVGQTLGLLTCAIAAVPLMGYLFNVSYLYVVPRFTGIALHTALSLFALGIGVVLARPTVGIMQTVVADDAGGLMARRLAIPAFLLPVVVWTLRMAGERAGLFSGDTVRPLAVLVLSISSLVLILANARSMSVIAQQRARAEREREQVHLRTADLLDSISDAFYAIDAASRFTYINRQAEVMLGRPRDTLLGRNFATELPAFAQSVGIEAHLRVMRERAPSHREAFLPEAQRWFDISLYPDAAGGVACFFRDVSERKAAEHELHRAKEAAERASQAKSEFLATLSHEMRTPLAPVMVTLGLVESHPAFPAVLRPDIESIRRNVELEVQLISDLLDLTRVESGKLQLQIRDVDLHAVLRAVEEMCRRPDAAPVRLELDAELHSVQGDPVRLHQIFWNLMSNALKFTPKGGYILVSTKLVHSQVRTVVRDTGSGIAPEFLPRLFNAFEQGESRSARQRGGLGLGLSITRKIVEAHGGTIMAESEGEGRGASFVVDLPAAKQNAGAAANVLPEPPAAMPEPMKILLVEDHAATLQAMARLLSSMGHHVTTAATCEQARLVASKAQFDFIISDLGLPDGSGLDLMRELSPQFAGRAIALSGYGMEADVKAAKDAGFAEHLTKPVRIAGLRAVIAQVCAENPPVRLAVERELELGG